MGGALEGILSTALLVKGSSENLPKASDALLLQKAQTKTEDIKTGSETDLNNGIMGKSDSKTCSGLGELLCSFCFAFPMAHQVRQHSPPPASSEKLPLRTGRATVKLIWRALPRTSINSFRRRT